MTPLEKEVFELVKEISPQSLYRMGLEDLGDKVFIMTRKNIENALIRARYLRDRCSKEDLLTRKFIESLETVFESDEPNADIGSVPDALSVHLIKEGVNVEHYRGLLDRLIESIDASIERFEGRTFTAAIKILTQYQVIGAYEVIDVIEKETKDPELLEKIGKLRKKIESFSKIFHVEGFTDGNFEQVMDLLKKNGPHLGRERFYPRALKYGFDYSETPAQLERKALSWIEEDLPKFKASTRSLAKVLQCKADPEEVNQKLRSKPGVRPEEALKTTIRIRPVVQALVAETIVGFNPRYDATVVETPSYLTPILPTGAAQDFDSLTDHPSQRFYITTDPKRAPPGGFADLVNLLVHEEYGHCLHFSNTATHYAANAGIVELLPSLHGGATSEGLAFQRELEFLEELQRLQKKKRSEWTNAEREYIELTREFGGFAQTLVEMEFITYKQRIIRFLRVVGDVRINSGKQDLLKFLEWAEKKTGLSRRTVFFQIFPAHEGIFPGYATCYAVVGQEIRSIQRPFRKDPEKMVKFNGYASSMGYPARSIYSKRLKEYAKSLVADKSRKKRQLHKKAQARDSKKRTRH